MMLLAGRLEGQMNHRRRCSKNSKKFAFSIL